MLDDLKEEKIVNKVGGRFKLSTLIQKRMVALNTGARPLVDLRTTDKMAIVIQEILQDKIFLDSTGTVQLRGPSAGGGNGSSGCGGVRACPDSGRAGGVSPLVKLATVPALPRLTGGLTPPVRRDHWR